MKQLIEETMVDQELNEALIDISEFKLGILNRLTADDIYILEEAGFQFISRSYTQRKQEVRAFLCGHPALLSGDYETMLDKTMFYLSKKRKEIAKSKQRRKQRTRQIKERYFRDSDEYWENDVPDEASSTHSKSSKRSAPKQIKTSIKAPLVEED